MIVQCYSICILTGMIFNLIIAVVMKLRWIQMQPLFSLCVSCPTAVVQIRHECLLHGEGRKWHCLTSENNQPFVPDLVMRISIVSDERFSLSNMLPFFVLTFPAFSSGLKGAQSANVCLEYLCNSHLSPLPPPPLGLTLGINIGQTL